MPLVRNKMKRNKTSSSEHDSRKGQSKYLQFFAKQHKSKPAVKTWIGGYPIFQAAPSSIATCSTNDNVSANIPKSQYWGLNLFSYAIMILHITNRMSTIHRSKYFFWPINGTTYRLFFLLKKYVERKGFNRSWLQKYPWLRYLGYSNKIGYVSIITICTIQWLRLL